MKVVALFAGLALLLYAVFVGTLALFQRRLLYFPDTRRPDAVMAGVPSARPLAIQTQDGLSLLAWYAAPSGSANPVVLYLHGNAGNIGHRAGRFARFNALGWGVLLLEYRGYGGNLGSPSEAGLTKDAFAGLAALTAMGFAPSKIILWGESLGTGLAVKLAEKHPVGALVLEAPYTSMAALARLHFRFVFAGPLLRDRYDSLSRIAAVRSPLLVMAGARDLIVPAAMARELFEVAAEPKEYWLAPTAGHNDLMEAGALDVAAAFVRRNLD